MRRALAFLFLLALFAIWTFPHRRVVERVLSRHVGTLPVQVAMGDVTPSLWPLGYVISDVRLRGRGLTVTLDLVQIQIVFGSGFRARACGGTLDGTVSDTGRGAPGLLELRFDQIDPATCVEGTPIAVSGSFAGSLSLPARSGATSPGTRTAANGSLALTGTSGTISGYLPGNSDAATGTEPGKPIGSWEFVHVGLRARLEPKELLVEEASADAENVRWEVSDGRISFAASGRTRISAALKARPLDDTPRAKAVLGVLPRAGEDADGWRRYRISGTLDAPKVIGLK